MGDRDLERLVVVWLIAEPVILQSIYFGIRMNNEHSIISRTKRKNCGADPDPDPYREPHLLRSRIFIRISCRVKSRIKMEPWRALYAHNRGMRLKMEPRRVCRPVVADLHHFDEEQDPVPHQSEKSCQDPH